MKVYHTMEPGSLLVTHISGKSTVFEVLTAINSVRQFIIDGEFNQLAIFDSNVCLKELIPKTRKVAYKFQQTFKNTHKVTIAVLAATDLVVGLFRIIQKHPEDEKINLRVFRSEAAARVWIQKCRNEADLNVTKTKTSTKKQSYIPNTLPNVPDIVRPSSY